MKKEKFFEENIKLVSWTMKKYGFMNSMEYEDMFQQGCVGLIKAIKGFDESKGFAFSSYAIAYIRGEMARYRDKNMYTMRFSRDVKLQDRVACLSLDQEISEDNGEGSFSNYTGYTEDYSTGLILFELNNKLTPRQRKILSLKIAGREQREIAEIIGISQPSISKEIVRIRTTLRGLID